ncbi:MAG: hypothetical protein R2712_23805 [Vicinamibacterales bacterium]
MSLHPGGGGVGLACAVVSGTCAGPPAIGFVNRDLGNAAPDAVRLFLGSGDGCATTMELEAGTTPGSAKATSAR